MEILQETCWLTWGKVRRARSGGSYSLTLTFNLHSSLCKRPRTSAARTSRQLLALHPSFFNSIESKTHVYGSILTLSSTINHPTSPPHISHNVSSSSAFLGPTDPLPPLGVPRKTRHLLVMCARHPRPRRACRLAAVEEILGRRGPALDSAYLSW